MIINKMGQQGQEKQMLAMNGNKLQYYTDYVRRRFASSSYCGSGLKATVEGLLPPGLLTLPPLRLSLVCVLNMA